MTVIVEYLEVKKKNLLINFKFDRENVFVGRTLQYACTLDKYMSLDNWKDIYHKLNRPIESYLKCADKPLSSEKISLGRAQLDLHVSWHKTKTLYTAIFDESGDKNWYPFHMIVEVKLASKITEYRKQNDRDAEASQELNKNSQKSDRPNALSDSTESGQSEAAKEIQMLLNNEVEEYVPTASTSDNDQSGVETYPTYVYTPMPVKSTVEFTPIAGADDEYTPSLYIDGSVASCEKNEYHPYPIRQRSASVDIQPSSALDTAKTSSNSKTSRTERLLTSVEKKKSLRVELVQLEQRKMPKIPEIDLSSKLDSPRSKKTKNSHKESLDNRQNLSQDLFGESDPDDQSTPKATHNDKVSSPARRLKLSRKAKADQNYEEKEISLEEKSKSHKNALENRCDSNVTKRFKISNGNQWLSKEKLKEEITEKARHEKEQKSSKTRKNSKDVVITKITNEEMAEYNENHAKKMDQMKRVQAQLAEASKAVVLDKIIDLKDLKPEEIEGTFDDFGEKLTKIFLDYMKQESHKVRKAKDYDHLSIHSVLLTRPHVHKMVDRLKLEYANPEVHGATAFNELFWELMVPEWALALFMHRFSLTREEAVKQIKLQDNMVADHSSSFEL